jgi:hypothetical protein
VIPAVAEIVTVDALRAFPCEVRCQPDLVVGEGALAIKRIFIESAGDGRLAFAITEFVQVAVLPAAGIRAPRLGPATCYGSAPPPYTLLPRQCGSGLGATGTGLPVTNCHTRTLPP